MKTHNGLSQADIDDYDAVALDILILLDPFTADEVRRSDFICECLWEAVRLNRLNKDKSDRKNLD